MENFLDNCVIQVYRKHAANDDITAIQFYLLGYHECASQKIANKTLKLKPGRSRSVLAICTGINFSLHQKYVALKEGVFGLDITDSILAQGNAATCHHPHPADVVISTQTSSLAINSKLVLNYIANTINPKWRLTLLKFQLPENWISWFVSVALNLMKPFAVTNGRGIDKPCEAIQREMKCKCINVKNISKIFLRDKYYF